jgi:hypothetical protein
MQAQATPRTQRAVLALALYEHPSPIPIGQLRHRIGPETDEAVAILEGVGLLAGAALVGATPAAVHFDRLAL